MVCAQLLVRIWGSDSRGRLAAVESTARRVTPERGERCFIGASLASLGWGSGRLASRGGRLVWRPPLALRGFVAG